MINTTNTIEYFSNLASYFSETTRIKQIDAKRKDELKQFKPPSELLIKFTTINLNSFFHVVILLL